MYLAILAQKFQPEMPASTFFDAIEAGFNCDMSVLNKPTCCDRNIAGNKTTNRLMKKFSKGFNKNPRNTTTTKKFSHSKYYWWNYGCRYIIA
jgi:hypothetical protein